MEEFIVLSGKLKEEFPNETKELYESIDLVTSALDAVYDSMTEKVSQLMKEQQVPKAGSYLQDSQSILDCRSLLLEYASLLEDESVLEEEIASIDEDEEKERTTIPDYEEYQVDNSVEHNLYEDFTYTKACAFSFCGEYVEVANMKWVLVETCGILAKLDPVKMKSLLTDLSMKGSKVWYFSKESVIENYIVKNEQIPGTDMYVWTASSCNQTRNLIKKLLKKFNIKQSEFKIYLRANYTDLHRHQNEDILYFETREQKSEIKTNEETEQKIGRYVQGCFDFLEKIGYEFSEDELKLMQTSDWTLKKFGIGKPLLRQYDQSKPIAQQTKIGDYNRYWKQPYLFGDVQYFVNSQWVTAHKQRFEHWYSSLDLERRTGETS